ncbi:MAG: hypothetical protein ACI93R_000019 [Flavobacteriales bacterium]|jgi:hypothetical protein
MSEQQTIFACPNQNDVVIQNVGIENTAVLIIDNYCQDITSIYNDVSQHANFKKEANTSYPGIRAKMFPDYGQELIMHAEGIIRKHFSIDSDLKADPISAFYSIVSTEEHDLTQIQTIPHYDGINTHSFAIMHYISAGNFGGTGFFRHETTGYENIDITRVVHYKEEKTQAHSHEYVTSSTSDYQLIHQVDYKVNRLVIYPGTLLHSGLINKKTDIYRENGTPRLTANIGLQFI